VVSGFKASILCIRFPFLYPRNRFTGTHYYNYRLREYYHKLYLEATKVDEQHKRVITNKPKYYFSLFLEFIHDYVIQIFHCIPTYTELDAMDKGWRTAFGIQLCKELKQVLKKNHFLYKYRITQIKEKWGVLCWYDNAYNLTKDVLGKYESISYRTCITCGKPAKYRTPIELWECPYCAEHVPNNIYKKYLKKLKV